MAVIYLTESGAKLTANGLYFQVVQRKQPNYQLHAKLTSYIVLFGNCHIDPKAASLAKSWNIAILFLDNCGHFLSRLEPKSRSTKYLACQLKRLQNREFTKTIAEIFLRTKLHNSCIILQQLAENSATYTAEKALDAIHLLVDDLPFIKSVSELRRWAEIATTFYYQALSELLVDIMNFGPLYSFHTSINSLNALLRVGNSLLYQTIYGFVVASELSPDYGILHLNSEGEKALVKDLAAQFQPLLVDGLIGELALSQILTPADFTFANGHGRAFIYPSALQKFLKYWQEKLSSEVISLDGQKVSYRQCLEMQVLEYRSFLLGDSDYYRSFLMKLKADAVISLEPVVTQAIELVKV